MAHTFSKHLTPLLVDEQASRLNNSAASRIQEETKTAHREELKRKLRSRMNASRSQRMKCKTPIWHVKRSAQIVEKVRCNGLGSLTPADDAFLVAVLHENNPNNPIYSYEKSVAIVRQLLLRVVSAGCRGQLLRH